MIIRTMGRWALRAAALLVLKTAVQILSDGAHHRSSSRRVVTNKARG